MSQTDTSFASIVIWISPDLIKMVEFVFPVADPEPLPLWQVGNEGNHWHSFDIISADPDQNHAASYSVVCVHLCVEEKSGLNSRNMETCMHTLAASPLRPWP